MKISGQNNGVDVEQTRIDLLLTARPMFAERGLSGNSKDRRRKHRAYCLKYGWDNVERIQVTRVVITKG